MWHTLFFCARLHRALRIRNGLFLWESKRGVCATSFSISDSTILSHTNEFSSTEKTTSLKVTATNNRFHPKSIVFFSSQPLLRKVSVVDSEPHKGCWSSASSVETSLRNLSFQTATFYTFSGLPFPWLLFLSVWILAVIVWIPWDTAVLDLRIQNAVLLRTFPWLHFLTVWILATIVWIP